MYYMYYPLITCFVDKKHVFSIVPNANYIQNTALFQISFFFQTFSTLANIFQ